MNRIIITFRKLLNIDFITVLEENSLGLHFNANLDTDFWVRDLAQSVIFDFYPSFLRVMETEASNSEKELSFDSNNLLHALLMYAGILLNFVADRSCFLSYLTSFYYSMKRSRFYYFFYLKIKTKN